MGCGLLLPLLPATNLCKENLNNVLHIIECVVNPVCNMGHVHYKLIMEAQVCKKYIISSDGIKNSSGQICAFESCSLDLLLVEPETLYPIIRR
jgi:hypothetical protein